MMIAVGFLIALPLLKIFGYIFENYLIAPVPPEVVALFCSFGGSDVKTPDKYKLGEGLTHQISGCLAFFLDALFL